MVCSLTPEPPPWEQVASGRVVMPIIHNHKQYPSLYLQRYIRLKIPTAFADTLPRAHLHLQVHHHHTLSPMTPTLTMDVPSTRLMPTHYSPPKVPPVNSPKPHRVRFVSAPSTAPASSPSRTRVSSGRAVTHYGARLSSRARTRSTSRSRRGSQRSSSPRRHGGSLLVIVSHIFA